MEFAKMKKQLLQLQEKDYQNFVKALVSIETKCDDEEIAGHCTGRKFSRINHSGRWLQEPL